MKYILLFLGIYLFYRFFIKKPDSIAGAEKREPLSQKDAKQQAKNEDEYIDYEEVDWLEYFGIGFV